MLNSCWIFGNEGTVVVVMKVNIKYLLIIVSHNYVAFEFHQMHFLRALLEVLRPHYNSQYCVFSEICPIQWVQWVICWLRMQWHSISA